MSILKLFCKFEILSKLMVTKRKYLNKTKQNKKIMKWLIAISACPIYIYKIIYILYIYVCIWKFRVQRLCWMIQCHNVITRMPFWISPTLWSREGFPPFPQDGPLYMDAHQACTVRSSHLTATEASAFLGILGQDPSSLREQQLASHRQLLWTVAGLGARLSGLPAPPRSPGGETLGLFVSLWARTGRPYSVGWMILSPYRMPQEGT